MSEPNGENAPLLGVSSASPSHSVASKASPSHSPNMRVNPPQVRSQSSMDSGCGTENEECSNDPSGDQLTVPVYPKPGPSGLSTQTECPPGGAPDGPITRVDIENSYVAGDGSNRVESSSRKEHSGTKVTFVIEGTEGEDEECDPVYPEIQTVPVSQLGSTCLGSRIPSFNFPSTLSATSSTISLPFCRICHHPEGDGVETLISPCRCSGTMKFIHHGCLMKWLEVSGIKSRQVPSCELCNYQFHRRKKFRIRQCQIPSCSSKDKVLHCVFLLCLFTMLSCAAVTVVCFKQNSTPRVNREDTELSKSDVVTLTCGVLFFLAFFVAMYVEVKATDTLYRLCSSFFYLNQTIHIYEYDKKRDLQKNVAV